MAEAKNNFLKSKMNKDLDDRLVPVGEYRNAQNVSIAKSEGNDVGALENILGNDLISSFSTPADAYNIEIIGNFMDVKNDRIVVFMTNYVDTSADTLSNFSPRQSLTANAYHAIGVYDILNSISSIVVTGRFLNFSKTHEIYNINLLDNLLFWTDNRNQPRKINLPRAIADNTYYISEDNISVSKYYPYTAISLIEERPISISLTAPGTTGGTGYVTPTPPARTNYATTTTGGGSGLTIDVTLANPFASGVILTANINNPGSGYATGDLVTITGGGDGNAIVEVTTETTSTMRDVVSDYLPNGTIPNPYRQPYGTDNITWQGDPEYLKDKFVRFSYRFKFDDGEYSLIAPFTQACFIPKQDGYFMEDDDARTFKSTEVDFMENKVNDITLLINAPTDVAGTGHWNSIQQYLKIEEVDILYKEAGQNVVKIVDTITNNDLRLINSPVLTYNYNSVKPWKTLPDSDILRVADQVPVRAFTQESTGNRIIYGNYVDKPTPPANLNYSCSIVEKTLNNQIEYQNQNLKQNRTYQVGIVLSDRYGRQSTVILSTIDESNVGDDIKGSTIFNKFKESPFSTWFSAYVPPSGSLFTSGFPPVTPGDIWDGDALNVTFWDTISSVKNSETGEPGLYGITNPLGWYSYKIVVKQTEQDYYNVYIPGILNGYADGDTISTAATESEPICHFALHGDNINKIPRDLSLVGPNQKTFRTGRPSVKEDPSYYQFGGDSGMPFTVDPFSEEGERLLKERDRERDLDSGSQITNASVKLSLRLNNIKPIWPLTVNSTGQAYPGTALDVVTTIGTGQELGLWDPAAPSPFNTCYVFYGFENNPYIAKTSVSNPIGTGLVGPTPNSGKFNFYTTINNVGTDYVAGSTGVPCDVKSIGGSGTGFKINIDAVTTAGTGDIESISIADVGTGWNTQSPANMSPGILTKILGAGNANADFYLKYGKTLYTGDMQPSLAVYETEPLESKLDIYWETSTHGLIDYLNTQILDGDITTPVALGDSSGNVITMLGAPDEGENRDPLVGGGTFGSPIYAINNDGNPVTGMCTFTLLSVVDGYNNNRINDFNIAPVPLSTNSFFIHLDVVQMCDWDQQIAESFTFTVNAQVPSDTWATDGTFVERVLTIGPLQVRNMPPEFIGLPAPALTGSISGGLIHTFNAVNGSVIGGGLETKSITFTITGLDPTGIFYLNPTGVNGEIQLMNNSASSGLSKSLTLNVFDGGGLTATFPFTVTLS
tara:strand:- start:127 stop:3819 length:3693 start_codon:yes stop_codon:yes gene_type:complete